MFTLSHCGLLHNLTRIDFVFPLDFPVQFSRCVEGSLGSEPLLLPANLQNDTAISTRPSQRLGFFSLWPCGLLILTCGFSSSRFDLEVEPSSFFRRTRSSLPRKEVIQPHLPIRLPCYDFTPVIGLTFDGCSLAVGSPASGAPNSHGVTGGVYKGRERIHRGMLIRDY